MARARTGNYARRDGEQYYVVGTVNSVRKVIPLTRDELIDLYDNISKVLDCEDSHNINGVALQRAHA